METKKVSPNFCLRYCYTESCKFSPDDSYVFNLLTIWWLQNSTLLPENCATPSSVTAIRKKTHATRKQTLWEGTVVSFF